MSRKKYMLRLALWHLYAAAAVIAFVLLSLLMRTPAPGGLCPAALILHIYCPGCGGTRALYALLRGQPVASLLYFPPILLGAAGILIYDTVYICRVARQKPPPRLRLLYLVLWVAGIVLWWVVRNALFYTVGWDPLGDLTLLQKIQIL